MRSTRIAWPPASTIATEIAIPASSALAVAVATIFLAPASVRRLASATYMAWSLRIWSARRRVAAFYDDILDDPRACTAERGRLLIGVGLEAVDRGLHGRKLDHDKTVKRVWSFHDPVSAAARKDLAAMLRDEGRDAVGVFLIL